MSNSILYISRIITFFVALQILNLGFLEKDNKQLLTITSSTPEDEDADDDIDSVAEFVSEVIIKKISSQHKNTDKRPYKDLFGHKHLNFKMIEWPRPFIKKLELAVKETPTFSFIKYRYYQYYKEINPPPPKA